jgi:hypothetical protein
VWSSLVCFGPRAAASWLSPDHRKARSLNQFIDSQATFAHARHKCGCANWQDLESTLSRGKQSTQVIQPAEADDYVLSVGGLLLSFDLRTIMAAGKPVQNGNTPASVEEEELAFGQVWKDAAKPPTRPKISDLSDQGRRRSSVQFHTSDAEETIRRESVSQAPRASLSQKRMASPPPPSQYHRGVSFDTFDNKEASTEAFTLRYKHKDYANTPRSRTFLCGTDAKDYSEYALEWMIDELIDDGDEIVCLRVIEKDDKIDIKPHLKYRDEANRLLESVKHKNKTEDKAISIVMELAVGKVQEIFQQMVSPSPAR